MFIKRIKAENFVSYRDLQMPEEFHPGCNLILGLNGQGKSNLLQGKYINTNQNSHNLCTKWSALIQNEARKNFTTQCKTPSTKFIHRIVLATSVNTQLR